MVTCSSQARDTYVTYLAGQISFPQRKDHKLMIDVLKAVAGKSIFYDVPARLQET
jgi:hypothetical protein